MTTIKVTEARGDLLNYLVATIAGYKNLQRNSHPYNHELIIDKPLPLNPTGQLPSDWFSKLAYASNPLLAYPIITGERISIVTKEQRHIQTEFNALAIHGFNDSIMIGGNTHFEAAMRVHVAYHLSPTGNPEVEVPDSVLELLSYDKRVDA